MILRLTFDQPMTCDGVLRRVRGMPYPCPVPLHSPMMSRDRRTFLTVCKLDAGSYYAIALEGFTSLSGYALKPYQLEFGTSPFANVTSIEEAIQEDRELTNPRPLKP